MRLKYYECNEFMDITEDILSHPEFTKTKKIAHHGQDNSVYEHSISTAFFAYRTAKRLHLKHKDVVSISRAALLHDFFGYDWRQKTQGGKKESILRKIWHMHAFQHGFCAADNAALYFDLSDRQLDAIKTHMFPLVPFMPKHKEGWMVTYSDKMIASKEMGTVVWHSIRRGCRKLHHAFAS